MGHYGAKFFFVPYDSSKRRYTIGEGNSIMIIDENNLKSPGFSHLYKFLNAMGPIAERGSQVGESGHGHVWAGRIGLSHGEGRDGHGQERECKG